MQEFLSRISALSLLVCPSIARIMVEMYGIEKIRLEPMEFM